MARCRVGVAAVTTCRKVLLHWTVHLESCSAGVSFSLTREGMACVADCLSGKTNIMHCHLGLGWPRLVR